MVKIKSKVIGKMNIPFIVSVAINNEAAYLNSLLLTVYGQIADDLEQIDQLFSPFKSTSLLNQYNQGNHQILLNSADFQAVYALAKTAQTETESFFDPFFNHHYDPTGLVKGWAIESIFKKRLLPMLKYNNICGVALNGGGDIQTAISKNTEFRWNVGIENPNRKQWVIGQYPLMNNGIATSGVNKRGEHIKRLNHSLQQLTIIDYSLTKADIWATAGMAAGMSNFKRLINEHRLSGVMIGVDQTIIHFSQGELEYVKTS